MELTYNDLKMLSDIFRLARSVATECERFDPVTVLQGDEVIIAEDSPSGYRLLDALDHFKLRASFTVPE